MRKDVKNLLGSYEFWLMIAVLFITAPMTMLLNREADMYGVGAIDRFYSSFIRMNFVLNYAFPLVPIFACSKLYFAENHKYRVLSVLLASMLIFLIPFSVIFVIEWVMEEKLGGVFPVSGVFFDLSGGYQSNFVLLFVLNTILLSAAYALLGWAVAQKSESKVNYLLIPLMLYEVDLFTPFAFNNELLLGLINGSYNVAWGVEYPLAGQVIAILFPLIIAGGIFLSMKIKTKKE